MVLTRADASDTEATSRKEALARSVRVCCHSIQCVCVSVCESGTSTNPGDERSDKPLPLPDCSLQLHLGWRSSAWASVSGRRLLPVASLCPSVCLSLSRPVRPLRAVCLRACVQLSLTPCSSPPVQAQLCVRACTCDRSDRHLIYTCPNFYKLLAGLVCVSVLA